MSILECILIDADAGEIKSLADEGIFLHYNSISSIFE